MATVTEIDLGQFSLNSVDRIRVTINKDSVPWNLSDGTVTLTIENPDRVTQTDVSMVAEDAANGIFYYDATFDDIGYWTLGVTVTDGIIVKRYPYEICLRVVDEP